MVEIVSKNLQANQKRALQFWETRLMSINDVSTTNDAICAGEQERQKVKKVTNRHRG